MLLFHLIDRAFCLVEGIMTKNLVWLDFLNVWGLIRKFKIIVKKFEILFNKKTIPSSTFV